MLMCFDVGIKIKKVMARIFFAAKWKRTGFVIKRSRKGTKGALFDK